MTASQCIFFALETRPAQNLLKFKSCSLKDAENLHLVMTFIYRVLEARSVLIYGVTFVS
jgi:hypothetical protein